MKRAACVLILMMATCVVAEAQTTIYWKRDTIYAGPGGGAIATVTPASSDTSAPTAPSSLGVTSTTATSVALSWTGSSDSGGSTLAGYKVYRVKGSGANLPVGTVNSSTTAFTDAALEPNTGYTYTIVAFDNAQNHSSASNSVNPTTSSSSGDSTAPTVPTGLTVSLTSRNSVFVRWTGSIDTGGSGLRGYKVYRGTTLISGSNPIAALAESGLSYNTTYAYKVEAVDFNSNVSAQTSAVNITTDRQLLFEDRFTRADGSLGGSWSVIGGSLGVQSLQATVTATQETWATATVNPGTGNYKASLNIVNYQAGFAFFVQGNEGHRLIGRGGWLAYYICTDLAAGDMSGCTPIGTYFAGGGSTLTIESNATAGTLSINGGAIVWSGYDSGIMSGGVGVTAYEPGATFDNFILESN
jgi:hypothetical protein